MKKAFIGLAAATFAIVSGLAKAEAGAKDYEFRPVRTEAKTGVSSDIAVRLIHKPDGKPVAGAVIFRSRFDMSPAGMGDMNAKLTAGPSGEEGVYRFNAEPTMAGSWALKLMAKVPGESETVEGTVIVEAKD